MPRPEIPPGARRELVDALHDLHHRAGWPSLRTLAKHAGCSHTTVSATFSSPKLPTWGVLELLVEAMDGDVDFFRHLWLAATAPVTEGHASAITIAGRRAELAACRRHLETGTGLLLVIGEAGIGKTRLVATAASSDDMFVASASCLPLSTEAPLMPVVDLLRSVHDSDGGQWLEKAFSECPDYVPASLSRLLPELAPWSNPADDDDEWARERQLAAVRAVLTALGNQRPLALVVEDLHWADSSTLDLLEHLVSRGPGVPIVGTFRVDDLATDARVEDWRARVVRRPEVEILELGPLTLSDTAEQLSLLLGRVADDDLVQRIHRRAQG
ncbi:MAG: AAA family ATPase, partial [Nocardioides sp.]